MTMTSLARPALRRARRRGSSHVLRGTRSAVEEAAEEGRHPVAIMVAVFGLGGALVAAVVAGDARERLGGRHPLDVRETRLIVKGSRNGHLLRAALLLLPCGPDIVDLLLLLHGRLLDGDGLLPEAEEASTRRDLLRAEWGVDRIGAADRAT